MINNVHWLLNEKRPNSYKGHYEKEFTYDYFYWIVNELYYGKHICRIESSSFNFISVL